MFKKEEFSKILREINSTYNSMTEFAQKASFDRTYISKYMNMKLDNPPTPKILEKLSLASNGIATYPELMEICGYYNKDYTLLNSLIENTFEEKEQEFIKFNFTHTQKNNLQKIVNTFLTSTTDNTEHLIKPIIEFSNEFTNNEKEVYDFITYIIEIIINKYNKQLDIFQDSLSILSSKSDNISNKSNNSHNDYSSSKYYMCPVYGRISAGQPNWAEECIEGRIPIDPVLFDIIEPEEHFFLRVNGESMNKVVRNGAYALIHKQDIVENGEIAVVLVNGDEATLKKFNKQGDLVILEPMSNDTSFQVQVYDKTTPIKIIGKYIGKFEINK